MILRDTLDLVDHYREGHHHYKGHRKGIIRNLFNVRFQTSLMQSKLKFLRETNLLEWITSGILSIIEQGKIDTSVQ